MDIYNLSRNFWNFSFENPEKIKPNHIAMYFFAIEHCNRLGWKEKFGFPTTMVMDAISIKSYNTFIKTLNDLVDYGFFKMIEKSKNQYSSNIIALSKFDKANNKALDKAITKHSTKQVESTVQSIDSIDIQDNNNTNLQEDNNTTPTAFSFYKSLISIGADAKLSTEWLAVRKKKKLTDSETAFNGFVREMEKGGLGINETLRICVEKSWGGLTASWLQNIPSETKEIPGETMEERTRRLYVERIRNEGQKQVY